MTKESKIYEGDPGDEHQVGESQDSSTDEHIPHIQVGLGPNGGIGVNVSDSSGVSAGIMLTIEEAEQLGARLIGLSSMLIHVGYMEMAREQIAQQELLKKIKLPR